MNWEFLRILLAICLLFLLVDAQVPNQQQQPSVQNQGQQQVNQAVNQQVPVQQPPINQQAQQQQFQQAQFQQQQVAQQQQVPPQQQQQQFQQAPPAQQQQQFQQQAPPVQQFQQPPPPVQQQQQFQQPPPPAQQQQQFQQPPPPQQQQFQQPPPPQQQQFQQPPPPQQQQFQQPPPVPQQQQFQQPPPQQFQQAPPQQQPPPPQSTPPPRQNKPIPPPIRKEQKAPKGVDIEAIRMPSSERFESDAAPNKAYVYFTAIVNSAARDCYFYRPITDFQVFTQVIQGGNMDIGLVIVDPSGKVLVNSEPKKEDEVKISVNEENRDQAYAICLDNRKSSSGQKVVYISIDININFENPSEREKLILEAMRNFYNKSATADTPQFQENISSMDNLLDSLGSRIRKVSMLAARTRNINTADRVTMEVNHQRISSWSLFQVVLMLLVALIQTAIIRSLFEGGRVSIWHSLFTPPSTTSNGGATFARA